MGLIEIPNKDVDDFIILRLSDRSTWCMAVGGDRSVSGWRICRNQGFTKCQGLPTIEYSLQKRRFQFTLG